MEKQRVLAISKSDMLDDELIAEIANTLPDDVPHVFISSVSGQGLTSLKDILWRAINDDRNRIIDGEQPITHRPLDARHRVVEEDEFIFENPEPEPIDEEEEMPLDDDYIWDEDIEPEDYE